ncbi:hypothetical protein NV379_19665 [Paenibacillus sp. N1-5-1-14]|nr:hypothetical protein [Paenibacillus radicibacter]MCR8644875.1 hypothetical protein [Paenibacillus radicibacter]
MDDASEGISALDRVFLDPDVQASLAWQINKAGIQVTGRSLWLKLIDRVGRNKSLFVHYSSYTSSGHCDTESVKYRFDFPRTIHITVIFEYLDD